MTGVGGKNVVFWLFMSMWKTFMSVRLRYNEHRAFTAKRKCFEKYSSPSINILRLESATVRFDSWSSQAWNQRASEGKKEEELATNRNKPLTSLLLRCKPQRLSPLRYRRTKRFRVKCSYKALRVIKRLYPLFLN